MSNLAKHGLASALALTLAIVFYVQSLDYPSEAANLPQILALLIIMLSLAMFAEALINERKKVKADQEPKEQIFGFRVLVFAALIALYITLIKFLGYFLVTPLFVIAALAYLKATRLWKAVLIAFGFTLFCYLLFVMFLNLPIPMGLFS